MAKGNTSAVVGAAAMVLAAHVLGGCADRAANSPTQGWGLSLRLSQPRTNKYVAYELERTGKLIYTAGERAKSTDLSEADATWAGVLTREEAAGIVAHLAAEAEPKSAPKGEGGPVYRVMLRRPEGWPDDLDSGPTPFLERLVELLNTAQRARREGTGG